MYTHTYLFMQSVIDGHWGCFRFGSIMNKAALNTPVEDFWWTDRCLDKYLGVELLGHNRQFSQAVESIYTVTSPVRELRCTTSQHGLPRKQALQQSLVCRVFMTQCPGDHLLQKGAMGSKAGQRKGSCMQASHLGLGWGVRSASQYCSTLGQVG